MTNGNEPINYIGGDLIDKCGEVNYNPFRLTKREYFAAMILQGLCANRQVYDNCPDEKLSEIAVINADTLITALNK